MLDANDADQQAFHEHLGGTGAERRRMTFRWAADRWIRYRIEGMHISYDGQRCVFTVTPLAYNEEGGTADFPHAAEIRFNVAPPTETAP